MPIKRPEFCNDEIYHIVIRAAGDSLIFRKDSDHFRAIFSLYEFNTTEAVEIAQKRSARQKKTKGEPFSGNQNSRDSLVEILVFCFMPNHIHLLLRQLKDNGVSSFMRKFGAGFVGYLNRKYNRKGPLFAKYRAIYIHSNQQLKIAFVYIHANPISLVEPEWKERGIKNPAATISFLEKYRWSSYLDYIGTKNFPSVINQNFILSIFGGKEKCQEAVIDWIKFKHKIKENRSPGKL